MNRVSPARWKFFALLLLVMCISSLGCSRYSTVSPHAYEYTKTVYSVCNRQDAERLEQVAERIDTARTDLQLTTAEADWLDDIVSTAQAGDWQDAAQDARRLMEAQVEGR